MLFGIIKCFKLIQLIQFSRNSAKVKIMASESSNQKDNNLNQDTGGNSRDDSFSDLSSFENRTIGGRFQGHLYHVLPAAMKVVIQFVLPALFTDFMGLLEKEFDNSCTVNDSFSVTTHIQGRSVTIKVIEAKRTIEVSGPGHKLWKDITFKRIANTLFTRFIQNFSVDFQSSINITNAQPQMTSTPMVTRPGTITEPAVPPTVTPRLQGTPMERQMAAILESLAYHSRMITSLQEQLSNLTTEVLKLQQQPPVNKTMATTGKNLPAARERTFSVLSVESERSSIDSADNDDSQDVINVQTPTLPRSKSKPKKLADKQNQDNSQRPQRPQKTKPKSKSKTSEPSKGPNTLIIGDSIINGINPKVLKNTVHCNGISGATVETVREKLAVYDLKNFVDVVIYVGGNDISNGSSVEFVESKYDQLLQYLKGANDEITITICTVCPRRDADVTDLNDILKTLGEEYNAHVVEVEDYFCTDGHPVKRYFSNDQIHLSRSGIRRLLDCIEKSTERISLVDNYESCSYGRSPVKNKDNRRRRDNRAESQQQKTRNLHASGGRDRRTNTSCVKCGETNHPTFQCKHKTQIKCHDCGFLGHKQSKCPNK